MNQAVNQHLIDNISQLLKRALVADEQLEQLRAQKKAGFTAIFTKDAGFDCNENNFQPYIAEVADNLLDWQKSQNNEDLVELVKKIEKLFKILAEFEKNYQNAPSLMSDVSTTTH